MSNYTKEMVTPINKEYFMLNNLLNIPNKEGKIQLDKDREAARAYFLQHINPNTVFFHNLKEKLHYLCDNDYIEREELDKYDFEFIKEVFNICYDYKFRFKSFMGAYKFYTQYALKSRDGEKYLERYEDRVAFNALFLANGDKELAKKLAHEIMSHRFQPATPTFLNAMKKARGELVSCFLIDVADNMLSIGRGINSSLQLSRLGGGVGEF